MSSQSRTRPNVAAKVTAPVVITSSYLETLKKTTSAPFSVEDFREKTGRAIPEYSNAKERVHAMRTMDLQKHKDAAAGAASPGTRIVEEEERRVKLQERARPILVSMREARVETMSEVQELNHKIANARVLDAWDKQMHVKSQRERESKTEEAMFAAMARERDMVAVNAAREAERIKHEKAREAAEIIQRQLEERAFQRELEMEAVELEAEQMQRMQIAREKAEREARRKAEEAARAQREAVAKANAAAAVRRAEKAAEERRAEEAVMHHMMEKMRLERERAAAEEQAKKVKEQQYIKMLSEQQKLIDKRGDEDAKRAKMHEETVIMRERARAKREKEAKESMMKRVLEERERQIHLKARLLEEEKLREAALLQEVLRRDVDAAAAERERMKMSRDATLRYKRDIETELQRRENERKEAEARKYEERVALQREDIRRARTLEEAKQRKIQQLRREGVTDAALVKAGLL